MKCLVTGGAGFIGSHLVDRLLKDGHKVRVIDNLSTGREANLKLKPNNNNLELIKADVSELTAIKPYFEDIDTVFHLAALADIVPSIVKPVDYYTSNVTGSMCVAEAAKAAKVRKIVYAASSSCYGIPDIYPTPETSPIKPQYPYALTKYLGEQILLHWGSVYKFPVISLRLFNVYGPRSRTSGTYGAVFGVFLAQKLNHKPFTVVGDGKQTRDFVFVTDVVDAFVEAAESSISNEIFNVGTGKPNSVNTLVKLLGGEIIYVPKRPGEPDCTCADNSKIITALKWMPKVTFEEGVKTMLDNIDYWKSAPVWTQNNIADATKEWFKYLS
jgi:UDP-glucose 4-epimerase